MILISTILPKRCSIQTFLRNIILCEFVLINDKMYILNENLSCESFFFSMQVDSKASFGENVADNGGFKEALMAYRKYVSKNGPEPLLTQHEYYTHEQLFTLGFANVSKILNLYFCEEV